MCAQLCCNTMDYGPPGSFVHRIPQARIVEWVAISTPHRRPNLGTEPTSPESYVLESSFFTTAPPGKPISYM